METFKKVFAYIGAGLTAILAIFLLFRSNKDEVEVKVEDAKLETKQEFAQTEIDKDKKKLEDLKKNGVENKKPDEVVDYWNRNLK